ncbi:M20/M25/M40 family metallo-hydrolase [Fuchsiella alkaliacetigena]|uniref:M20/M25/M40 family metallo-hydrolase n=1 Tax=Fuchsiella alkaliacetigena TaxID=957042 RepID=UPI00200A3816|nr:M20/M25/M40 family metallo-hydrolase [Fuchsiella alkaliacetigena]MCK8823752.1 M20/M25/M40 family metallo-hydrolase [Fuchsiella alkaliacetigena]
MDTKEILAKLSNCDGVSGAEIEVREVIEELLADYVEEFKTDALGNSISLKRGNKESSDIPRVMLVAHMDEIGLMVKEITEQGFLRFTTVGGIDKRTLIGQEVLVYGKDTLEGIIGAKPPHVQEKAERKRAIKLDDMYIDLGLAEARVKDLVSIGDIVVVKREFNELTGNRVSGKALDDRAGIAVMIETLEELERLRYQVDLFVVSTVQEEVGVRGAITSTYGVVPDIAVVIDVCHGRMPGVASDEAAKLGSGPAITLGPQVHPQLHQKFKDIAKDLNIDYQIMVDNNPRGTDAFAVQVTKSGIATSLISIPLRYMHTSVEALDLDDIKSAARLIANFINRVDSEFVEGLECF